MREIKFRGKRILEPINIDQYAPNGWVYGGLIDCSDEMYILPYDVSGEMYIDRPYRFRANDYECRVMLVQVEPKSIGQFTGLKDKNGVEIYEGDIVCIRFSEKCKNAGKICFIGDIQFREGMFGIECTQWRKDKFWWIKRLDEGFYKDIEVIGNIYDNMGLLEAQQ